MLSNEMRVCLEYLGTRIVLLSFVFGLALGILLGILIWKKLLKSKGETK